MRTLTRIVSIAGACFLVAACNPQSAQTTAAVGQEPLVGAWRSQVRFSSGALAEMKDLEFMYVFNSAGTLTESSNYDGAPPVPPAYGIWKQIGPRQYEARYEFYITKSPETFDAIAKGGGWNPNGRGVLTEKLALSEDQQSFTSSLEFTAFDSAGKRAEGGGSGTGSGIRMRF